jgi:hypothetical protein
MPIFSFTRSQKMLDECRSWLPQEKQSEYAEKISSNNTSQCIPFQYELAMGWALAQFGTVKAISTSKQKSPDFTITYNEIKIAVEVTTLSNDNIFAGKKPLTRDLKLNPLAGKLEAKLHDGGQFKGFESFARVLIICDAGSDLVESISKPMSNGASASADQIIQNFLRDQLIVDAICLISYRSTLTSSPRSVGFSAIAKQENKWVQKVWFRPQITFDFPEIVSKWPVQRFQPSVAYKQHQEGQFATDAMKYYLVPQSNEKNGVSVIKTSAGLFLDMISGRVDNEFYDSRAGNSINADIKRLYDNGLELIKVSLDDSDFDQDDAYIVLEFAKHPRSGKLI